MLSPYYQDSVVTLYHGDVMELLPHMGCVADVCVTDPPYGETAHAWDRWPPGWCTVVDGALPAMATSVWMFGSLRMFVKHADQLLHHWTMAQESLWLKANGSGPGTKDRLLRVHEWAVHLYRGAWTDLHHDWPRVPKDHDLDKSAMRRSAGPHRGIYRPGQYDDDGLRLQRSARVYEAPRTVGRHRTEKPLLMVTDLVRECTAPGRTVLDPFAGSCTTGVAAHALGDGRQAVLFEADEATCELGAMRLAITDKELTV